MTTAIKHLVFVAKAPTAEGTFDGVVLYNPKAGDADGERVADWTNFPKSVPMSYQHAVNGDPGAVIGTFATRLASDTEMDVKGALNLDSLMAQAVYERMLLPDSDPLALKELSVGFAYDPSLNTKDPNGVIAIHGAELLEISVVYRGAQETQVLNVKALMADVATGLITYDAALKFAAEEAATSELGDLTMSLLQSAREEFEAKYMDETMPGSMENQTSEVRDALSMWATGKYGNGSYAYPVGTFSDRVVAAVYAPDGTMYNFQFDYTVGADGNVTLSNPTEVEVQLTVTPAGANKADTWDGAAAMATAKSAADFAKIAFERTNSSPANTAAHWALPHHDNPQADANPIGVSAALGALHGARGGVNDLVDPAAAEKHLTAHQASFQKADDEKAGRVLSKANESALRSAAEAILSVLAQLGPEEKAVTVIDPEVEVVEPVAEEAVAEEPVVLTEDQQLMALLDALVAPAPVVELPVEDTDLVAKLTKLEA